jgi:hypothetical protein
VEVLRATAVDGRVGVEHDEDPAPACWSAWVGQVTRDRERVLDHWSG